MKDDTSRKLVSAHQNSGSRPACVPLLGAARNPAGDYFLFAFQAVAWAEAFMAIGAAYATRMIPLRFMAMFGNIFGFMQGLAVGSLPTIVKHSVNFPLNAARAREMRRLVANVTRRERDRPQHRMAQALYKSALAEGPHETVFERRRSERSFHSRGRPH